MPRIAHGPTLGLALLAALSIVAPACGGGGGGPGPDGAGQGLALVSFLQNGVNNVSLNQVLEFRFSEPVDASSINEASFQVREGPTFGRAVVGVYRTVGSTVFFEPQLPGRCDLSDAGFQPGRSYRVTLVGFPEQFTIRNTVGQPLRSTSNFEFRTRVDTDPQLFIDQIPASPPVVIGSTPLNGTPVVQIALPGTINAVVLEFSENLDPCTINATNIRFQEYERGNPGTMMPDPISGRNSGFNPITDTDPNPYTWGSITGTPVAPAPQVIRATLKLVQSFSQTTVTITPDFGKFPENALCVVELSFGIKDLGNSTLPPTVIAFTTENLAPQVGQSNVTFGPETLIDTVPTTADVNTLRSPGRAQGWFAYAGDGDNGTNKLIPSLPNLPAACTTPRQLNDGVGDNFDTSDYATVFVNLDTGVTRNTCPNAVDSSRAVVWEFGSFRIRAGRRVNLIGNNPAIILVKGAITIEATGQLNVRGLGLDGVITTGGNIGTNTVGVTVNGGVGYAGGGNGGLAYQASVGLQTAGSGRTGFGSPSGVDILGGTGTGGGGTFAQISAGFWPHGGANGGGGGGHSSAGLAGGASSNSYNPFVTSAMGTGGVLYGAANANMLTPESGSGGGGGGSGDATYGTGSYEGGGGSGGGGGGFVDLTGLSITVNGRIDATGGAGGNAYTNQGFYVGGGGAGGGSGGGIRLLTSGLLNVAGATITTAGGVGGIGNGMIPGFYGGGIRNDGGAGGSGRVALEDGDGIIDGLGSAAIVPAPAATGFYSGVFNAARFGNSLYPVAVTGIMFIGPANPNYSPPPAPGDFVAGIPIGADRGLNASAMLIEAEGYQLMPDGSASVGGTGWKTVGHFRHSGVSTAPTWVPGLLPVDLPPGAMQPGNTGGNMDSLDGCEFLRLRISFFMPSTIAPADPGPYLDNFAINFLFDQ